MNEDFQLARHPDADDLCAFAEGLLPPHEREQTSAHLAVCAACREVVALALPPVEELQPVAALPPRRRLAGWRWLWTGAAVCAALGLAAVPLLRHHVHSEAPAEVARMEAPHVEQAPALTDTAKPALPMKKPAPPRSALPEVPAVLTARAATPPPWMVQGGAVAAEPAGSLGKAPATTLNQSPPALAQNSIHGTAMAPAPPPAGAGLGYAAPAPAALPQAAPMSRQRTAIVLNEAASPAQPDLPSHLPAASLYTAGKTAVAVDTAGTVFVSRDAAQHWSAVAAPWSGLALQVTSGRLPAPGQHAAVFAVTTSAGQRWTSDDGTTWVR